MNLFTQIKSLEAPVFEGIQGSGNSKLRRIYTSICPFVMMEDLKDIAHEKEELCSYFS